MPTEAERHQILQSLAYGGEAPDDVAEAAYEELDRMWQERVGA